MTTKTDEQELLPCPFCGAGTTEVQENGRPWLGTRWGDPVSVSVRHWCDHVDGQPSRMIERVGRDRTSAIDAWNRRAALQSQDREDAATEATGGDENGGHRLVEPDHETAMALADAPRSLRNYVAALRSAIALQSQDKEDAERYRRLRKGDIDDVAVVRGLGAMDYGASAVIATYSDEIDGDDLDSAIDHARRIEGDGE